MLINLDLYAGPVSNGNPNECRAVLNALRFYAEHIHREGFAEDFGDAAATLQQLLHVSLLINEGFVAKTEQLDSRAEIDGAGVPYEVFVPLRLDDAGDVLPDSPNVLEQPTVTSEAGESLNP
jgi:hypothetical protein